MTERFLAIDFETSLDGKASMQCWHPNFRIDSCAFSWWDGGEIKSAFVVGERQISRRLCIAYNKQFTLVAHNLQYELACWKARFPEIPPHFLKIDTARLGQLVDNGGSQHLEQEGFKTLEEEIAEMEQGKRTKHGLGLQAMANRFLLKEWHNHKEPFYRLLREEHNVSKGKEGSNLHLLPMKQLRAYNVADTEVTLALHKELLKRLGDFNWQFDHKLHLDACHRITEFYLRGVRIDRELLSQNLASVAKNIAAMKQEFLLFHEEHISVLEKQASENWVAELKTEKGRENRQKKLLSEDETLLVKVGAKFNPGSTAQLQRLFIDQLGFEPVFFTKPQKNRKAKTEFIPQPSFRASHLHTYGEGGRILENYRKLHLVQKQLFNLQEYSAKDGRWHLNLSATGTKTSRFRGASDRTDIKLNCQGLARRNRLLMETILPEEEHSIMSVDLTAGEPTVTAHYSQDENFLALNFGMIGKTPFYNDKGILIIDDVYLGGGSVHPNGASILKEAWHTSYKGKSFAEQWVEDRSVILEDLKTHRSAWKTSILALQYGQGAKGMVETAYDHGHNLMYRDAKKFRYAFWHILFPKVRLLAQRLERMFERKGYMVNAFGYRLIPDRPSKCLNYYNQSSVSGIIKLLESQFYLLAKDYAKPLPPIHDEILAEIPDTHLAACAEDIASAMRTVNRKLNWSLPIRNGFVLGKNWYEAK